MELRGSEERIVSLAFDDARNAPLIKKRYKDSASCSDTDPSTRRRFLLPFLPTRKIFLSLAKECFTMKWFGKIRCQLITLCGQMYIR